MLEIILKQGFCPLKNKITQFPNFHFDIITSKCTSSHVFMSYMSNLTKGFFLFFDTLLMQNCNHKRINKTYD